MLELNYVFNKLAEKKLDRKFPSTKIFKDKLDFEIDEELADLLHEKYAKDSGES